MLRQKEIGGVTLLRPRTDSESQFRAYAEDHLRSKYDVGTYSDASEINSILRWQFEFLNGELQNTIKHLSSRSLITFLLSQYDATCKIRAIYQGGKLSEPDRQYWERQGPTIRRSIKHLCELVTLAAADQPPREDRFGTYYVKHLEGAIIACEMVVELYALSDHVHLLSPNNSTLTIFAPGNEQYYDLQFGKDERHDDYIRRVVTDTNTRRKFLDSLPPDRDVAFQAKSLDDSFVTELGFSYRHGIAALTELINNVQQPDPDAFDVPFIARDMILTGWRETPGWPHQVTEKIIGAFELDRPRLEKRAVFKPQQEHRALRRGLFAFPHASGQHLIYSREMARECLISLISGISFQKLPAEWRTPVTRKAAGALQNRCGEWFEQQVARNMSLLGVVGQRSFSGALERKGNRISVPADIGDLDYLGYSDRDKSIILIECKFLDSGMEPRFYRDDISAFVTNNPSFSSKLLKKAEWVRKNAGAVCRAISSLTDERSAIEPTKLLTAFVTLVPTFASYFVADFPCVSLSEFVNEYKTDNRWPYSTGIFTLE